MGRSIPSFRQLIDIERLNWSEFKKELPSKNDKHAFDQIFENTKLYTSYLSNTSNPIPLDSILMGALFHNYKVLSELTIKEKSNSLENESDNGISFQNSKILPTKLLHDNTYKKWKGLIYALHGKDEKLLLRMLSDICQNDESLCSILNKEDSKSNIAILFYLAVIIQNQKLINNLDKELENKEKKTPLGKLMGMTE